VDGKHGKRYVKTVPTTGDNDVGGIRLLAAANGIHETNIISRGGWGPYVNVQIGAARDVDWICRKINAPDGDRSGVIQNIDASTTANIIKTGTASVAWIPPVIKISIRSWSSGAADVYRNIRVNAAAVIN
jgi:hypothetical protein